LIFADLSLSTHLELAGGGAGGDGGTVNALLGLDLDLDRGVAAGIEDLARLDGLDGDLLLAGEAVGEEAVGVGGARLRELVDEEVELLGDGVLLEVLGNDGLLLSQDGILYRSARVRDGCAGERQSWK